MIIYVCKSRSQEIHRTRPDYEIFFYILAGFLPAGVWHGPIPKSKSEASVCQLSTPVLLLEEDINTYSLII